MGAGARTTATRALTPFPASQLPSARPCRGTKPPDPHSLKP
ncbi:hypothetical protein [Lysobacter gummosus]